MSHRAVRPTPTRRHAGLGVIKILAALVVTGGLAVGGWAIVGSGEQVQEDTPDIFRAATMTFQVTVKGNGELRAKKQTSLRSELEKTSAIVQIVPEGTMAKKGDLLVELNGDEIREKLDTEMLQLESARSDLISAENDYEIQVSDNESALRKALLDLELAELELRKWQEGEVEETRLGLQLDIERAEREHERLKAKAERSRELYANGFLSKDELDQDELRYVEAESNLKTSNLAAQVYENFTYDKDYKQKNSDVEESRAEIDRVKRKNESELASKEADRTNRRRQLQLREERVAKLEQQVAACEIVAPTDGLVVYATSVSSGHWRNNEDPLDVGSDIRPNQEIVLLPDTSEMIAAVKIPEAMLGRVKPGQGTLVTIDAAQGRSYTGVVETIGVMAQTGGWRDPNVREYEVRIALDMGEEAHELKPSMRCEAEIVLAEVDESLAVPIQSVFTQGRHRFVYTVDGDRYAQTEIRLGRRSDTYAEILDGLAEGQLVLKREPAESRIIKAQFAESTDERDDPRAALRAAAAAGRNRPATAQGEGDETHKLPEGMSRDEMRRQWKKRRGEGENKDAGSGDAAGGTTPAAPAAGAQKTGGDVAETQMPAGEEGAEAVDAGATEPSAPATRPATESE